MRLSGMEKGDELTVTTDEVSRSAYIQSKATKYVTELKVVLKDIKCGGNLFYFPYGWRHSGGMNFIRA